MSDDLIPKHYDYTFRGNKLDPYRILLIYKITHPALQHAVKKLLRAGRSEKDIEQDIQEVIVSLERFLEMKHGDRVASERASDEAEKDQLKQQILP